MPLPGCVSEDPVGQLDQWEGYQLVSVTTPGFGRWDLNSPLVRKYHEIRYIILNSWAATNTVFSFGYSINKINLHDVLKYSAKCPSQVLRTLI